ncbi:ABC transporter ATP-binding protein [Halorubrum ezzemoulense]|uniref:ABC transporter ATP-binding protein n=1 Tax=Halorubrum ezzemoulense TaxID=337243 RepID=UPI00232C82A4|nr:ABC transporter ATP-binding protein [Halorubrum ezzemoulense]MDB9249144.1 ABC transporter ATP-binding protein [Halorubrum ezzemoulense]MDB9259701.1 ABC transporter ATP-binding protein [Halorubrum ezzemoulense]MDB9263166.1 ABC transporter ATP-binding protein [Halorubrum ezzemoulense]MDB9266404.1 ABC transporter ATP-binding protein [Halorubrum ezzemoulense]MDB9270062.1 ABC transporter ATP-binding protein [Halorubrum ezzemoulense]
MSSSDPEPVSRREKLDALRDVARYNPKYTAAVVVLGIVAAVLEGVGLSFILPIVELVQFQDPAAEADGLLAVFVTVYQTLGIPFTLGYVVVGVSAVMVARYTTSFSVAWFREALRTYYIRDLQTRAFRNALNARVEYFDKEGSDDILNAIVTQTYYAGRVIQRGIQFSQQLFLAGAYFVVALVIAPVLTIITGVFLGGFSVFFRRVLDSGYDIGDEVAEANEMRQEAAQAGTQGIRDVRIFGLADELFEDFSKAVEKYTDSRITLRRNEAAINNFYNLVVAVSVFVLIYLALTFASLSVGELGVFLFAMFRLGPRASNVNTLYYQVENDLPHLVRTQEFIEELDSYEEPAGSGRDVPEEIREVEFDDVHFSYDDEEEVLRGIDFTVEKGEFVGFVGQSGAGKSTIVSLLARLYPVGEGEIRANRIPIDEMNIAEWRDRISMVRQDPFIFNDTLWYNLTLGNRDVAKEELNRVCSIAKVNEFIDELPDGYNSLLGDDGVRLSGGQQQRVALARALLDNADLLILDEATSDLDSNLEKQVQQAIEEMDRDYAVITIAHRLSTVKNADRIYTIEEGQVMEKGQHDELVEKGGKYSQLYEIQSSR